MSKFGIPVPAPQTVDRVNAAVNPDPFQANELQTPDNVLNANPSSGNTFVQIEMYGFQGIGARLMHFFGRLRSRLAGIIAGGLMKYEKRTFR